jgi:iron complex transport system ATP-binding protein
MIQIEGLSHRIGRADILKGIDLTLPKGQITALIGPNGAGKSTLLSLIGRLMPLQTGRITVDGADVTHTPTRDLARRMAILSQSNQIGSRLRVAELVGFGRWPHHQGRPGPLDEALVAAALHDMDLMPLAARFLDELSGGQRQRAFMAMTLAQGGDWLLLDEPLAALDMAHARSLMQKLVMLRGIGRSIVVVLHEVNHAAAWADHVVMMKAGGIMAQGTPDDVFTEPTLKALYDMELRVIEVESRPMVLSHL